MLGNKEPRLVNYNVLTDPSMAIFKRACELAKIKPTIRQRKKFEKRVGLAYSFKLAVLIERGEAGL